LEVAVDAGRSALGLDSGQEGGVKEGESVETRLVAGGGDNVVDDNLLLRSRGIAEADEELLRQITGLGRGLGGDAEKGCAEIGGDAAFKLGASEPPGCGAEVAGDGAMAQALGQCVEDEREICGQLGAPAHPDGDTRVEDALLEGARFLRWGVEGEVAGAGKEMGLCAGVGKFNGEIDGGRAGTEDKNAFAAKAGDIGVLKAMADEVGGCAGKLGREVGKQSVAHGEDDATGLMELAGGSFKLESRATREWADGGNEAGVEVGHEAVLELDAVVDEARTGDGEADIGVGKVVLAAVFAQREAGCGGVEVGGEAFGLEEHAGGHVGLP